jgi:hypothetical protein
MSPCAPVTVQWCREPLTCGRAPDAGPRTGRGSFAGSTGRRQAAFGSLAAVIARLQEIRPRLQGEAVEAAEKAEQSRVHLPNQLGVASVEAVI